MIDFDPERDPLDVLAEDFARRCRGGNPPSVNAYAEQYPQWAGALRELLPPVARMEELKRLRQGAPHLPAAGPPLERLGDYRILREVGRGGMGVVYEAVQESLSRQVALKVLAPQALPDPRKRERFQREAQAAARLHHTNIVPVFGVGEQDGLPYYVMQFIPGEGLNEVLARWRRGEPAAPGPETPAGRHWREIARIGVQAAEALHYAHQQNILHRDVKPANLLLDAHGTVWVTDFGLAKWAGQKDLTATGDLVGTLQYMAPENFQGQADARSDVYSLGLTLYELLTRQPPFQGATLASLLQQVTEQELPRPRRRDPAIPRDLETIVLKATARDPDRRYPTAAALAEDLQRFLDDRPIRARRATALERGWRWCRRNRALAALAATALAALLLAVAAGWVGYVHTTRALAGEARKRDEAAAATQKAEANVELGLQKFEEIFNCLAERDPAPPPRRRPGGGRGGPPFRPPASAEDAALLRSILSYYDQFAERNTTNPRLQKEAARAHRRVAQLYQRLGQFEKAEKARSRAVALCEQLARAFPSVADYRHELAQTWTLFDPPTARPEALARAEKQLGRALALAQELARANPGTARYTVTLARLHGKQGALQQQRGRCGKAGCHFRRAVALLEPLVQRAPSPSPATPELAQARQALAEWLLRTNRPAEARVHLEASIADLERVRQRGRPFPPLQGLLASHYQSLAEAWTRLGETALARRTSRQARELSARGRPPFGSRRFNPGRERRPPRQD
jgi:tetratricopeptide (TPR) repeat protein